MTVGPWQNVATIQTAACDHSGTTSVAQDTKVASCSACGNSWPQDATAPKASLTRQVSYPPPA